MRILPVAFLFICTPFITKAQNQPDHAASRPISDSLLVCEPQHTPPGGMDAFYQMIYKNLKYPKKARRNKITGRVYVSFVVQENGEIRDVAVIKGLGYGCDEEAMRVIKLSPRWNPAMARGKPKSEKMVIPVMFKLNEDH